MVVAGLLMIVVAIGVLLRAGSKGLGHAPPTVVPTQSATPPVEPDPDAPVVHSLRPWVLRGIEVEEAEKWIDCGFDADHAYLLRSMGVDLRTAARLRTAGLDDSALVALVEEALFRHDAGREDLIALAELAPDLAPLAVAWMAFGVTTDRALAYTSAGFTPVVSDRWTATGWDMDEALPWFTARFTPASAKVWRENGFGPEQARAWKREHFGVKQAVQWRRLGDTLAQAREVEKRFAEARVTVADGLRWLDRGFSVDEICAGWPSMVAGKDAGAWRADWKGLSLSPSEVKAWNAKFDRDEAARWLEAGVRDPAAATRLRARGLGPQQVESIASDRLSGVFKDVPVTRDDLLSAAGQLARAGGSPAIRRRLQIAASVNPFGDPKEVKADLIDEVLGELRRLGEIGMLGAPHAARALARRLERGLIVSALLDSRSELSSSPSRLN